MSVLRSVGRRLGVRRLADELVDRIRLQMDLITDTVYQPLEYAGLRRRSSREEGTRSRWQAMKPVVMEARPQSAADLGCNVGWFSFKLASLGIRTIGVEHDPVYYRTALYSARKSGVMNFALLVLAITPDTAELLPGADCMVFLSLWHHLVSDFGFSRATAILRKAWQRTGRILFFETGEREMPASFGLPDMGRDSRVWLQRYLEDVCDGSVVEHLGRHHGGWEGAAPIYRNLFVVRRDD